MGIFLFATVSIPALGSGLGVLFNGYRDLFSRGERGRGVKLTNHLYIMPRLKMDGARRLLPQYVFMARCLIKQ
jgi:hypothetical protein